MRGIDTLLLEKSDFSTGATGRSHGMLHGGGRYAVKDPASARECASESRILRRIAPYCIEDTGGVFVGLEEDADFADRFRRGCRDTGVSCEEISVDEAFRLEPSLSREVRVCFRVEDGAIDPFSLTLGNIRAARQAGARSYNHARVIDFRVVGGRIERVRYARGGKIDGIRPEVVVNATGAWANEVAGMAGLRIPIRLDKGSLILINGRLTSGLVNRLRSPSDGDIIVPSHSASIIGTTSMPVESPESPRATREEVDLLIREARRMVPELDRSRAIRAYAGIRPLPASSESGREISRTFRVIDHSRDGVDNMISVIGGKLTTYRLMAEKTSDLVMRKLGRRGRCRTMIEEIVPRVEAPKPEGVLDLPYMLLRKKHGDTSGIISRVEEIRGREIVCSCEQVLRGELVHFCLEGDVWSLGDLMRRTRAGMGYCQSGACVFGLLSCLVEHSDRPPAEMLAEYLRERWRGILPVLHLGQMRQEVLKLYLDAGVYSLDHTGGGVDEKDRDHQR